MPDWDPEANDLFLRALEITEPDDRKRFLDEACATQPALRTRVEALIRSHEQAGEFLGRPILEPTGGHTLRTGRSTVDDAGLDFLALSDKPGSLGRLGHYEVQAVIGRGGMGVVLKAFDETLHRVVAIKVMARPLAIRATARQRFTREARAQAAVAHEHVVTIHAVEETNGLPYLVMQYVAGTSLQERLDQHGSLRLAEVLRIGAQAALGLAAAHKQGLVHRDVKPANILLENGLERVKLTDFGLARAADDARLTSTGQITGTPQYMSPEQAEGKPLDARSDLFSLGSVLYAMCAGHPPFRAANTVAVLNRVCDDTPTPIREVNPEVPEWLADVIAKLHAKNPRDRFQSADELADLLGKLLARVQHPSGVAEKPTAPKSARRWRRWAGAALLVLLAAGLVTTEATGVTCLRAAVARVFGPDEPAAAENGPAIPPPPSGPGPVEPVRPAAPVVGTGAFVILDGGGAPVDRAFPTLAEAVQATADGDTIEIRGDGPFVSATGLPAIRDRRLTIRAGAGARPVIRFQPQKPADSPDGFLFTFAPLVLEGIEFQARLWSPTLQRTMFGFIGADSKDGGFRVANCRFHLSDLRDSGPLLGLHFWRTAGVVQNCEFISEGRCHSVHTSNEQGMEDRRFVMGNCVVYTGHASGTGLAVVQSRLDNRLDIRLSRNTFTGKRACLLGWAGGVAKRPLTPTAPFRFDAAENVFATDTLFAAPAMIPPEERNRILTQADARDAFRQMLECEERRNVYDTTTNFYELPGKSMLFRFGTSLEDWAGLWGRPGTTSKQGLVLFNGGERIRRAPNAEAVELDGFRLKDQSAGKGAGEGGRDPGADVDLVGPGAAYEKWKKTPAYQQWLKDSGQLK
jgi:hypothetical protein